MCGRFALLAPGEAIADMFGLDPISDDFSPRYNVAPTQPVAAVRIDNGHGKRVLTFLRWGLIPAWAKDINISYRLINARGETVAEKPSFRAAFKRRRCLIPASGFYEWQQVNGSKQPMYIHPADGGVFALAGLWETWHSAGGSMIESCTIITTTPNELVAPIHDRMPVIVEPPDFDLWLNPGDRPGDGLHLLRPYPPEKMATYPVTTLVNNPRNEDPGCIEPTQ